jgi:arginine decarboxylase-like protein
MIKNWKLFKESVDSEFKIHKLCKEYNIKNYTINDDFSIDVDGDVNISYRKLDKIPLRFRDVSGNFLCSDNNLTSLLGCPEWVGGNFHCYENNLTSL